MIQKTEKSIIIAGAGLVGLSFALCMKNHPVSIKILETHLSDMITRGENNTRPISLSFGSIRILQELGVWETLSEFACSILSVHVSEQGRFGFTEFSAKEQRIPALGYVVPFGKLQSALYHAVAAKNNITLISIKQIENIHCDINGAVVKTDADEFRADLFVAADGTQSSCRDLLKIAFSEKTSGDVATIYQLTLSEHHTNTAYERFTKHGVLAILPLHDKNKAQLVWTHHSTQENNLALLQDIFDGRLLIQDAKKIATFPLKTVLAEKQMVQSAVLLGNAAHTIYPVAAQGFNLGLRDAAVLSDVLIESDSLSDLKTLEQYEEKIKKHQQAIFYITDQLASVFDLPLIGGLRGLGLFTTDFIFPVKNKLAKRMMGMRA